MVAQEAAAWPEAATERRRASAAAASRVTLSSMVFGPPTTVMPLSGLSPEE